MSKALKNKTKLNDMVSVKDFGAVGDGVTDDTAAIVAALATGKDVLLPDGTYKLSPITTHTVVNRGYQRVYGDGDVTLSVNLASSINLFSFDGPVSFENVTIDFNNSYARCAFKWNANAGHICLKNIRVENLKDIDSSTGSITFWIVPTGNTFDISGITATSMLKRGNGIIADAEGSYNLIYVGGGTGSSQGCVDNVRVSEIHNINASDQIIYEDTAGIYIATDSGDTQNCISITNVQGYNFGKRLLKIHASNVSVTNVTGYSPEGDSLGLIGFISGQGMGSKYGCSVNGAVAYGLMEYAFFSDAPNTAFRNITASIQPPTKAGMGNSATALLISNDNILVDNLWTDSQQSIAIGSASQIIKNTTLLNIYQVLNSASSQLSIHNASTTTGYDGLVINNLTSQVSADAATAIAPINLGTQLNGTTKKGRNISINNFVVKTDAPINFQAAFIYYCENVSVTGVKYINTSGNSHFRLLQIQDCVNVNVDDVEIEGTNQIGVYVKDCTGRATIGRVYNPSASVAAVYNSNSANVWVYGCDQTKVSGITTATPQSSKQTFGITATRPTTGLVAGYSHHFDSTLMKPIWWTGTDWVDATGTVV